MARVIVVGGGTAGCILAARLSEDPNCQVVVLEAGEAEGERAASPSSLADLATPDVTWPDPYTRGRGLGGSSRVNGAVLSGPIPSWLPAEEPTDDELGPVDRALLSVAGAERVRLMRRGGQLLSTADLVRARLQARQNLHIIGGAQADHVRFAGRRAIGVALDDGEVVEGDRVVLCAGTIGSARLLLRSGVIGPALGAFEDHAARVVDLDLSIDTGSEGLVTGSALRRDGIEIVVLNHVGRAIPRRAAVLAGWLGSVRTGRVAADGSVSFEHLDDQTAAGVERAVELAVELLAAAPFREIVGGSRVAIEIGGYFHAAGSCRGVVDHRGRVVGYDDLLVVDASVLALPPHGPLTSVIELASTVALR